MIKQRKSMKKNQLFIDNYIESNMTIRNNIMLNKLNNLNNLNFMYKWSFSLIAHTKIRAKSNKRLNLGEGD